MLNEIQSGIIKIQTSGNLPFGVRFKDVVSGTKPLRSQYDINIYQCVKLNRELTIFHGIFLFVSNGVSDHN